MNAELIHQFHQHSRMLRAAIDDVPTEQWTATPIADANPLAFLATHLTEVRFYIAKFLELDVENPLSEEIQKARSATDVEDWPSPPELLKAWDVVDAPLEQRIAQLDAEWLDAPMETRIPWEIERRRDMLAFFAHHEAYHLGQMGMLRSALGLPKLMMKLVG